MESEDNEEETKRVREEIKMNLSYKSMRGLGEDTLLKIEGFHLAKSINNFASEYECIKTIIGNA